MRSASNLVLALPFCSISAGVAGAEDLQVVTDLSEAMLLGHRVGPSLDRRAGDLDCPPTCAADQMMMVPR